MTFHSNVLNAGFVRVYDVYGNDLTVVNAARVSFGKMKESFDEKDEGLCKYLAEHEHNSPFRQAGIVFHVKMPIFVMRQYIRHRVGVEVNEISGRYVEFADCDFYIPEEFRLQSKSNKQGSDPFVPERFEWLDSAGGLIEGISQEEIIEEYKRTCEASFKQYKRMLNFGIAKEMARMVLPLSLYTEYFAFMSLQAVGHFCRLRFDGHAQKEIRSYAEAFNAATRDAFPKSYGALMEFGRA